MRLLGGARAVTLLVGTWAATAAAAEPVDPIAAVPLRPILEERF